MHIMVYIVWPFFVFLHLFKASLCQTKIIKLNLHLLRMISMTMSSSHSQLQRERERKKEKKKKGLFTKAFMILIQDLGWPKVFPPCNLLIFVKLPNSTIEAIYFIAFLLVALPVYHHSSPFWVRRILAELQYHWICQQ